MKYSPRYFKERLPSEKKSLDSFIDRFFSRPVSFVLSALFASAGISANWVSFLSLLLAIGIDILLFLDNFCCRIVGSSLIFLWMILDCVDGNIARCVKKEKYGEFIDATSSYFLTSFIFVSVGKAAFDQGGLFLQPGNSLALILGGFFAVCSPLMRLLFQKFKNSSNELEIEEIQEQKRSTLFEFLKKAENKIESEIGINGCFPVLLLLAIIFKYVDLFLVVYGSLLFLLFLASALFLLYKVFAANRRPKNNDPKIGK